VDRERLERRRLFLKTAIAYVEDQRVQPGRATQDFLDWCRHELSFVEVLLQEEKLLNQVVGLRLTSPAVAENA
jgi:hypothetical protein